jgi:hypothetical protein
MVNAQNAWFIVGRLNAFSRVVNCVTACFALWGKCVNDTTVLRRENHVIGTALSWGQLGDARLGTVPKRKTHARRLRKKDFKRGEPLSEQAILLVS